MVEKRSNNDQHHVSRCFEGSLDSSPLTYATCFRPYESGRSAQLMRGQPPSAVRRPRFIGPPRRAPSLRFLQGWAAMLSVLFDLLRHAGEKLVPHRAFSPVRNDKADFVWLLSPR
jgi:hypothetical protein